MIIDVMQLPCKIQKKMAKSMEFRVTMCSLSTAQCTHCWLITVTESLCSTKHIHSETHELEHPIKPKIKNFHAVHSGNWLFGVCSSVGGAHTHHTSHTHSIARFGH